MSHFLSGRRWKIIECDGCWLLVERRERQRTITEHRRRTLIGRGGLEERPSPKLENETEISASRSKDNYDKENSRGRKCTSKERRGEGDRRGRERGVIKIEAVCSARCSLPLLLHLSFPSLKIPSTKEAEAEARCAEERKRKRKRKGRRDKIKRNKSRARQNCKGEWEIIDRSEVQKEKHKSIPLSLYSRPPESHPTRPISDVSSVSSSYERRHTCVCR